MALFLGIDGGGTGCRAAVCDDRGAVLGEGAAGPSNIASDPEGALENLLTAARAALPAGAELTGLHAVLGLAGANVGACAAWLRPRLPFARARIETDARTALAGALRERDGIIAATGTGTVYASQRSGTIRHLGGWGLVLGDEGSGAWIGRQALAEVLQAVDGLRPMTPLAAELLAERGGADAIVAFAQAARPADLAALAPRIAASGDPLAAGVMGLATGAVARSIAELQGDDPLPVVFLGGLGPIHADRLAGRWRLEAPLGTALDGALWLALQTR